MCTSVERIFVEAPAYDRFVELLLAEVRKVKVGGPDEGADMGPMTFPKQIETVERHIKDAIEKGAKILFGGKRVDRPGQFHEPTIVTEVRPDMEIYARRASARCCPS
jgi:acyl-CoA reductase-like NAD-dependent aldehyde dehydrogenase